jgi:hypothetical protein
MLFPRVLVCAGLLAGTVSMPAAQSNPATCSPDLPAHNPVTCWAGWVQSAIQVGRPPASSEVLHALVALAVYDAVIAVEGGYEPYAGAAGTHPGADLNAAVATAAYVAASTRLAPAQANPLHDNTYLPYMNAIPPGPARDAGFEAGMNAAQAVLTARLDDGFGDTVEYQCSTIPPPAGEFEPNFGCGTQPVDVKLSKMRPYTLASAYDVMPNGPELSTEDFLETRDYGRDVNSLRSPQQTDIVYFWNENTYVQWNRNLIRLAVDRGMSPRETARMFAMVHTASADAIIVGFTTKYHYRFWRPRTAIPRLDDPAWKPLLSVNHPEYPSAHAFWSTALTDMLAHVLGTHRLTWTIDSTAGELTPEARLRTYKDLNAVTREIDDARVWAGLHWRHSMRHGAKIGREVAKHVSREFFRPLDQ